MDLLALIKNTERLRQAVTTGEIAEIVSDAELQAARQALLKVKIAAQPTQQIWSAVNHLEAAHERLKSSYSGKGFLSSVLTSKRLYMLRMLEKDRFVLCLMACCYFVLGEIDLCRQSIDEAEKSEVLYSGGDGHPIELIDPRMWREFAVAFFGNKSCCFSLDKVKQVRTGLLGEENTAE